MRWLAGVITQQGDNGIAQYLASTAGVQCRGHYQDAGDHPDHIVGNIFDNGGNRNTLGIGQDEQADQGDDILPFSNAAAQEQAYHIGDHNNVDDDLLP